MKEHSILSVNQIFHLEISKLMHKIMLNIAPKALVSIFQNQTRAVNAQTRSSNFFNLPNYSSVKCRQSLKYMGPLIWNDLPSTCKWDTKDNSILHDPMNFNSFLTRTKSHCISEVPYIWKCHVWKILLSLILYHIILYFMIVHIHSVNIVYNL